MHNQSRCIWLGWQRTHPCILPASSHPGPRMSRIRIWPAPPSGQTAYWPCRRPARRFHHRYVQLPPGWLEHLIRGRMLKAGGNTEGRPENGRYVNLPHTNLLRRMHPHISPPRIPSSPTPYPLLCRPSSPAPHQPLHNTEKAAHPGQSLRCAALCNHLIITSMSNITLWNVNTQFSLKHELISKVILQPADRDPYLLHGIPVTHRH